MVSVLMVVALIAGLVGLVMSSQATSGVAIIAFGCLIAIVARLVQADKHHRESRAAKATITT